MRQDTYSFLREDAVYVEYVVLLDLILQLRRYYLVEDQSCPVDVLTLGICQDKAEVGWGSALCRELNARREAKVTERLIELVVRPVSAFKRVPI